MKMNDAIKVMKAKSSGLRGFQTGGPLTVGQVQFDEEGYVSPARRFLRGVREFLTPQPSADYNLGNTELGVPMVDAVQPSAAPVSTLREAPADVGDNFDRMGEFRGNFGLRGPTRRTVPGSPGIYREDRPGQSPLYTDDSVGGRVSTIQTSDIAKGNADKLTASIAARLASDDPRDRDFARSLAVTPEHRAMIANADSRARMDPAERLARDELATRRYIADTSAGSARATANAQIAKMLYDAQKDERTFQAGERDRAFQREGALAEESRKVVNEIFPGKDDDPAVAGQRSEFIQFLQSTMPTVDGKSLFSLPRPQLQQIMQQQLPRFRMQQARNASVQESFFTPQREFGGVRGYDAPVATQGLGFRDIGRGVTGRDYVRSFFPRVFGGIADQGVRLESGAVIPTDRFITNAEERAALERDLARRGIR